MLENFFQDYNNIKDLKQEFEQLQRYEYIKVDCNKSIEDGKYKVKKADVVKFNLLY